MDAGDDIDTATIRIIEEGCPIELAEIISAEEDDE